MTKGNLDKKVRDLMIPITSFPHMPYWATLLEAVVQLTLAQQDRAAGERRRSILVFDEAYKLLGVLNQREVLRGIEPKFARSLQATAPLSWDDLLAAGAREQAKKAIKEFMVPVVTTVTAEDNLIKASHIMLSEGAEILPVMEGNRVLGVVCLDDIFVQIGQTLLMA